MSKFNYLTTKVRNIGNDNDPTTGNGKVDYEYLIGKYHVSINQYVSFLNSVAFLDDPNDLYNISMYLSRLSAGIIKILTINGYTYLPTGPDGSIIPEGADTSGNRPITNLTWSNMMRFANWISNGQPIGGQNETTTENGAYNLLNYDGIHTVKKNKINPNTNEPPLFYLPTENEWYKAAYYNPTLNNGLGGYYLYATQSNENPQNVLSNHEKNSANYITEDNGLLCVTQQVAFDTTQNYLTNIGAFFNSSSYYGTYDQTGNAWEILDPNVDGSIFLNARGGAFTSFIGYTDSKFSINLTLSEYAVNFGFRLAGHINKKKVIIPLKNVDDVNNLNDPITNLGSVSYKYSISEFLITIENYTIFLNAVASHSDPNNLYTDELNTDRTISGILRSGNEGNYYYSVNNNYGDSSKRPITYVSWFCSARFTNWLSNGQPEGIQDSTTTENGSYDLSQSNGYNSVYRNSINPNTGKVPLFYIPTPDEWYKAAYYSPRLNNNTGGYYLFGTQSNEIPGNYFSDTDNAENNVNYVTTSNLYFSVTQSKDFEVNKNYLTDIGAFKGSKSYYQIYDASGNVSEWNDMNSNTSVKSNLRGGSWVGADQSIESVVNYDAGNTLKLNDIGFRLSSYYQV